MTPRSAHPALRAVWRSSAAALVVVSSVAGGGCEGRRAVPEVPPPEPGPAAVLCPTHAVPRLGVVDAVVDEGNVQRWLDWRRDVDEERLLSEVAPDIVRRGLRIEQEQIGAGCLNLDGVVDVGRALFLRTFTREDGWGNALAGTPSTLRRVQEGRFGGPDALSCQSCHWKGGSAGAGDRADNAYMFGDGDDVGSADVRNPPALWGAGWVEIVAREMSAELQAQAEGVRQLAIFEDATVVRPLTSKGISFGSARATPDGAGGAELDLSAVVGIDEDLVVKPFGWKGTAPTLRDFLGGSLQVHLGLQAEEVVAGHGHEGIALGVADPAGGAEADPDQDGVTREITEGQLTALVLYLATLDVPPLSALDEGPYREAVLFSNELEIVRSPEFTSRWLEGFASFGRLGCASCHVPFVRVDDPRYRTTAPLTGSTVTVDLAVDGAQPGPDRDDEGRFLVPVFSDFKRHEMGPGLAGRATEDGVDASLWMTRRLWGVSLTSPYLHTGAAITFDEAIAAHGGEAEQAARNYALTDEDGKVSLRIFLASLARAPSIRIR